jgi:hypothetical protein
MLSAFYHPQNAYVIAIDDKATKEFKADMERLGLCLPNVLVFVSLPHRIQAKNDEDMKMLFS